MKTSNMDYEKKYKEALEKIRSLHRDYNQISTLINVKEELENIFPELAESEDERIRKALMQNLKERFGTKGNMGEGLDMPKVLAWLEKQCEQKGTLCDTCRKAQPSHSCQDITALGRCALEKQGELMPVGWSKEDERNFDIIYGIIYNSCNAEDASRLIAWLKSLKDRVQSQPNQEWSEEYRITRNALIKLVETLYDSSIYKSDKNRLLDWLKSLRPQSTWKPSKKQMKDLAFVADQNKGNMVGKTMISLYKDLTKLTE